MVNFVLKYFHLAEHFYLSVSEYGSTKLLNTDPIWMQIHNTTVYQKVLEGGKI